ncbi:hypothetical protein CPB84DRAFT_252186 [Gymnopilus junonius]|uniref:Uncharacterized protein n=1 Tax=Gymnopilus junonius TaxID=109634 RepID=A0A9P5THE3_GYMJU|nr:hypothetical protein CPB84DRAFT_252186 [Gymnopilus junonius]
MLIALAAECTATYSLSKYDSLQTNVQKYSTAFSPPSPSPHASLHNNDIIDSAITTIVFCVLVATVFGADFFFLVFWPERMYPGWYNVTKKALAMVITAGVGVAAIISTVVISTRQAFITGVSDDAAAALIRVYFRPPLVYRTWAVNIAWIVLLWVAFAFTVASTLLMFIAAAHDDEFGPTPKSILKERESKVYLRANEGGQVSPALPSVPESRQAVLPNRY